MSNRNRCPDPMTLAALVEGTLSPAERKAVLAHLDECDDCMSAIDLANETFREDNEPKNVASRSWWFAVAAAVVIALLAVPLWRSIQSRFGGGSLDRLVAAAPRSARVVEPRLSGGFAWAAYRGPNRASDPGVDEERLALAGEAGRSLAEAKKNPTPAAQHTAGVAMLLVDQPDAAIERLESAIERAPNDAHALNDLAAAQYAAAEKSQRASLYPLALAAADRALRIDPKLPEALFNRALILERLGLTNEAREAWQRYLDVDSSSAWATEARDRLAKLASTSGQLLFDTERPRLEQAAIANDVATVRRIVASDRERSRAFGEAEYLGQWGEAVARGDASEAAKQLAIARAIGDALAATSGESLLRDAVRAIDAASDRGALAAAHATYRRGRILYAKHQPAEAEPALRDAARRFGGSPMALVARYYAANTRFDQADLARSRAELEQLLRELESHPPYLALGAQVRWELALCHASIDDWSGALPLFTESAALFRRLDERSNLGFVETLLADTLAAAGRPDESAAARIRSFALASSAQRGQRLAVSIAAAATAELRTGRREAARAFLNVAQSAARTAGNDTLLVDVLLQSAILAAASGEPELALREAGAASDAAQRVTDAPLRARTESFARLAQAVAYLPSNPRAARDRASEALAFFNAKAMTVQLPLAYLIRARAGLQLGTRDEATRDLESGIAALEAHQIELTRDVAGGGVLDAAGELFDEAMTLALERGDVESAFAYAERDRRRAGGSSQRPVTIAELKKRLIASRAAVLEISVLPAEVVSFAISGNDIAVNRHPIARAALAALVTRAATLTDEAALRELHEVLIARAEPHLGSAQQLIIVSDPQLEGVPFAALIDRSGRPLIARLPIATAMSATALTTPAASTSSRMLLAVGLPSGNRTRSAALPEIEGELADVAAAYRNSSKVSPSQATLATVGDAVPGADVVHIAGHTERQRGADDAALVFGDQTATWSTIAAMPLRRHAVVVLAACETLRRPRSQQTRALSLGAGFLAAGAGEVIGTLAPIADRDAGALFREVHRHLAAGSGAAEAVRNAQMAQIARGDSQGWRALAVLTSEIH
jgi:tetratricopeptide (TPR) repeat protein